MSILVIKGKLVDSQTRCKHYHSVLDVIAIKFKCCQVYYPCFQCHEEIANHAAETWAKEEWDTKAILCGVCKYELSVTEYFICQSVCPNCQAHFNPKCEKHYDLYFQV